MATSERKFNKYNHGKRQDLYLLIMLHNSTQCSWTVYTDIDHDGVFLSSPTQFQTEDQEKVLSSAVSSSTVLHSEFIFTFLIAELCLAVCKLSLKAEKLRQTRLTLGRESEFIHEVGACLPHGCLLFYFTLKAAKTFVQMAFLWSWPL